MSEENKTIELNDEDLGNVTGSLDDKAKYRKGQLMESRDQE